MSSHHAASLGMTYKSDAMWGTWQHVDEARERAERVAKLLADIQNPKLKHEIARLQNKLVSLYVKVAQSGDGADLDPVLAEIQSGFLELKDKANQESLRLAGKLTESYHIYAKMPTWAPMRLVPSFDQKLDPIHPHENMHQTTTCFWWQAPADGAVAEGPPTREQWLSAMDNECGLVRERIVWFADRSKWARLVFVSTVSRTVELLNQARSPADLGLDPEQVMRDWNALHPEAPLSELPFPADAQLPGDVSMNSALRGHYQEFGQNAAIQFGPPKDIGRAQAKLPSQAELGTAKYPDTAVPEKYICDWVRCRVVFANPLALVLFFWYVSLKSDVLKTIRAKNKLLKPPEKDTSANIHLNVHIAVQGEHHSAEIQLLLENFLIAKELEHAYYEIKRASKVVEVLAPIFGSTDYGL